MIDLKVKPYCQACPEFEPCSEKLYADGISVATVIRCKNAEICNFVRCSQLSDVRIHASTGYWRLFQSNRF